MNGHEVSGWYALAVIGWVISLSIAYACGAGVQRANDRARTRHLNRADRARKGRNL